MGKLNDGTKCFFGCNGVQQNKILLFKTSQCKTDFIKQKMYLQCAVECPDMVQFLIDRLVFTAFYKGGPEFPFCGWFTVSYRWEAGLFQMDIQLLHLIWAVPMIPCNKLVYIASSPHLCFVKVLQRLHCTFCRAERFSNHKKSNTT